MFITTKRNRARPRRSRSSVIFPPFMVTCFTHTKAVNIVSSKCKYFGGRVCSCQPVAVNYMLIKARYHLSGSKAQLEQGSPIIKRSSNHSYLSPRSALRASLPRLRSATHSAHGVQIRWRRPLDVCGPPVAIRCLR